MWASLGGLWHWWILLPWNIWLDYADKVVKIAAVLVGGVWAYYGFFKKRVHRARLEPTISASIFQRGSQEYLFVAISLKNVGSSTLSIQQEGTALEVFSFFENPILSQSGQAVQVSGDDWKWQATLPIFERNAWIDSSEQAQDELLVLIPGRPLAVKVEARIVGDKIQWSRTKIIPVEPQSDRSPDTFEV